MLHLKQQCCIPVITFTSLKHFQGPACSVLVILFMCLPIAIRFADPLTNCKAAWTWEVRKCHSREPFVRATASHDVSFYGPLTGTFALNSKLTNRQLLNYIGKISVQSLLALYWTAFACIKSLPPTVQCNSFCELKSWLKYLLTEHKANHGGG